MKTCLVVDDSKVIRKVARHILETLDFEVREAGDGREALDSCLANAPDVILLDWNMPVMSGMDFLRALRDSDIPTRPKVVFCTTENDLAHIARAMHAATLKLDPQAVQALIGAASGRSKLLAEVSTWLKRLDLADAIEVTRLGSSMLYQLEIVRGEHRANLVDVGYGVSQVLPLIVLLHFVPEGSVILCEDPEAHLHPMAQAVLADLLVEVAHSRRLQVLVETHSEHLFRRLQYLMAAGTVRSDACGLYYVERAEAASSRLVELRADEFGRIREWPENVFGDAIGLVEEQTLKMFERMKAAKK